MTASGLDVTFWLLGPLPIWLLAISVYLTAVMTYVTWRTNTTRLIASLERATIAIEKIVTELAKDTSKLRQSSEELNQELALTRKSTESLHKTLRRSIALWFPYIRESGDSD